ncbi:3757_t:CDS:2, partial [Funneliformis geosporum]
KSKGTIIDIPGKQIGPNPIIIPQSSNSQETNNSNKDVSGGENEKRQSIPISQRSSRIQENNDSTISVMETRPLDINDNTIPSTQYEANPDVIVINEEGSTIDVVSQAPQDILMEASQFMSQATTRSSVEQSKSSEDLTQRRSLQKFPTSPKVILSFTNDSVVKSSCSSNSITSHKSVVESRVVRQDSEDATTSQNTIVEESDVATEDSSVRLRQRKTPNSRSKKRTRSNNDDEQSEDSSLATSSSSKQSKRRKRSSSVTSITSSTNTDGSTKSNSTTTGKKRRGKPRKPRSTTRKQQTNKSKVKPWEDAPEDENPIDDSIVTMAELCKDLKRGRKSNTYKELEYAKYQKSQQKRRQRTVANNTGEDDQLNVEESETLISQHLEEWEQDEEGNWIQYENYDENEEYQQENIEENIQDENSNVQNDKPTLMKRRVFSTRGSRFVNADGQYTVRQELDSRSHIYENDEGMEVIEEDKFSHIVNSFTYSKKPRKNERWTIEDTELFFKALSRWGTDFEIISRKIFNNRKSRDQVKNKYKRERKFNSLRVYKALDTRIPIEPEELEIISRYTEELATPQAVNNTQDANAEATSSEVHQDNIIDVDGEGSAFGVELDEDHQGEMGSVFSFDGYPDADDTLPMEMDY